ncbi:MAG: branched-chain amino acid ABC transporter permease [Anaerolineae bacterium]|nr:branched-chain amino acid ABC transporter permease [Anaerolineae bacterium]
MKSILSNPLRLVGALFLLLLAYIAINNILSGNYTVKSFLQQSITGLAQGGIYALIALGYTLVYGILLMINFAHGEIFMTGAYIGFFAINAMDQSGMLQNQTFLALLITMLVGVVASVTIALLLERIAYRPLRGAPRLVPLITAIGASISLQQLFLRLFGPDPRVYPRVNLFVLPGLFPDLGCSGDAGSQVCRGLDLIDGLYRVDVLGMELRIRPVFFLVAFFAIALMVALWFFVQRTKTGKAMRAVAEDKNAASLMGINVDRVIATTFVLGAALAGAGAVLFALYNQQVTPFMGFIPGIKAFTAAVLGGIGNIPGAMIGGFFLGIVESTGPGMLGISSQLKDVIAFGLLVLILIFRPTGIFGEVLAEKKA